MNKPEDGSGKAKEVPWPQNGPLLSHCAPEVGTAGQAPTDNPGIRQSHVTILVGISGDDLDWGFSCAGSDTEHQPAGTPTD